VRAVAEASSRARAFEHDEQRVVYATGRELLRADHAGEAREARGRGAAPEPASEDSHATAPGEVELSPAGRRSLGAPEVVLPAVRLHDGHVAVAAARRARLRRDPDAHARERVSAPRF